MKLYYFDENDEEYKEYTEEDSLCSKCSEFNKTCIGATDVSECKSFKLREGKIDEEGDAKETRTCVDCARSHYHGGKCLASHLGDEICGAFEEKKNGGDNVEHPAHYKGTDSLECIDVIQFSFGIDGFVYYCAGNVLKYLWRYNNKNGTEDIKKAKQYLDIMGDLSNHMSSQAYDIYSRSLWLYKRSVEDKNKDC